MKASESRVVWGAVRGVVIGGVLGAVVGAIEGAIVSGLGVPVGILTGFIAGAVPGGTIGAVLAISIRQDLLRAVPGLTEEEAIGASGQLARLKAAPGEVIVRQGDLADRFYVVSKGEVEVVHEQSPGESVVATLGPGAFFGEIALLRPTRRTATVRASKPTELIALEGAAFSRFLAGSAGGREHLDKAAADRSAALEAGRPPTDDPIP
jgi:Cyclic nucleotide-binding domain